MAAPKGNDFWTLRSTHGRAKLFASPKLMWDAACEYFTWCKENPLIEEDFISGGPNAGDKVQLNKMIPFTMHGLCLYLDCNIGYFTDFEASLKGKEGQEVNDFSNVITRIRETIYNQKFTGAATGFFNHNIIARDLGLIERKDMTTGGEKLPETNILSLSTEKLALLEQLLSESNDNAPK